LIIGACSVPAAAQELEPRAYAASPIGATFLVVVASRSSGGVLIDPALPVEDVHARLAAVTIGAGHTFKLFTRTALVVGLVPYARAKVTGRVEEMSAEVTRSGLADARAKLSLNLIGGRALRPAEFARSPRSTIVGVSVSVIAPTGQYFSDRLINLGSHRWSWKPDAGISVPIGRWTLETYAGVWIFGDNDAFFPGNLQRTQDPVFTMQGHVSYTVRTRLWLAFDATWYSGGTTTVGGVGKADLQRNSRVGAAMSLPLGASQSLKIAYSAGATTRIGGDFNTVSVAWQMTWVRQ
jgi:hypothetical protein